MTKTVRVVHYLNQFFGGIGGEEHANAPVQVKQGPVGPGRLLQQALAGRGSVVATIICGDNYAVEEGEAALREVDASLGQSRPDVVIAGPAFDAGRYGIACALICRQAQAKGIPAVTGMHPENTGILTHRRDLIAVPTASDSSGMQPALSRMAALALRLARGETLGPALEEGYIPRGFRRRMLHDKPGAQRAFEMVMARVAGHPFVSEVQVQRYDQVPPAPPVKDLSRATIALITSGGLVPKGNPDHQVGGRAEHSFRYSIGGLTELSTSQWESVHAGFSTRFLNTKDPSYTLPLPTVREMERQGALKAIYPYFFSTTGNGTAVGVAKRMAHEIAQELQRERVDAALLVAT
jgi:glycine reductase